MATRSATWQPRKLGEAGAEAEAAANELEAIPEQDGINESRSDMGSSHADRQLTHSPGEEGMKHYWCPTSSSYELRLKGISSSTTCLDLFAIWCTQIDGSPQVRGTLGIHTVASVSTFQLGGPSLTGLTALHGVLSPLPLPN